MFDACLQERLKAQKEEAASNPEYGSTYKPQTSKEDRSAKRKQILSNIGMVACLVQITVVPKQSLCAQHLHALASPDLLAFQSCNGHSCTHSANVGRSTSHLAAPSSA